MKRLLILLAPGILIGMILATVFAFGWYVMIRAVFLDHPAKPERRETPQWFRLEKENEQEPPDSPEQVLITIRTRNGQKWVAIWEEIPKARPQ